MIKFKKIIPMLYTKQLDETVDFYCHKLGFTCNEFNLDYGWVSLSRNEVEIMLAIPNNHVVFNSPLFTGSFYVVTENVDELWDELKDTCQVCYPISNFDYGMREFAIYDNNNYLIQFGQEITLAQD